MPTLAHNEGMDFKSGNNPSFMIPKVASDLHRSHGVKEGTNLEKENVANPRFEQMP